MPQKTPAWTKLDFFMCLYFVKLKIVDFMLHFTVAVSIDKTWAAPLRNTLAI